MYQPNEDEKLLLEWAIQTGIYSPQYFAVDDDLRDVWFRVYRSLDVFGDVELYHRKVIWLEAVLSYLKNSG